MRESDQSEFRNEVTGKFIYYPVMLDGLTVAYLWASADDDGNSASVVLVLSALDVEPRVQLAMVWHERLGDACAAGLTPQEALESWVGKPEHSVGGAIPESAEIQRVENLTELDELANPGHVEPSIPEPEPVVDGFPMDRNEGWGPLGFRKIFEGYSPVADGPVRYLPVRMGEIIVGYLWASDHEGAASYVPRNPVPAQAIYTRGFWAEELHLIHRQGLTPLEAIRFRAGLPEHPKGGRIDTNEKTRTAASTKELEQISRQLNG